MLRRPPWRVVATDAHEGPVYVAAEHALYFTSVRGGGDPPRVAIRRLDLGSARVQTVVAHSAAANGMTLAPDGRLVVCEQGGHRPPACLALLDPLTGRREVLTDGVAGVPLNSPNDVVVGPDGAIWFTDPSYGHRQGFRPPPRLGDHVLRCDVSSGATAIVADRFDKPNGLAFAPDGRTLYVTDSGAPCHVVAFAVHDDGTVGVRRTLFAPSAGAPDGLKVDAAGRIYCSAATGVEVFDRDGAPAGTIGVPGAVNFAFGGPGRDVLFITTDTAVWAAELNAKGA
jgi:gluconolactonase